MYWFFIGCASASAIWWLNIYIDKRHVIEKAKEDRQFRTPVRIGNEFYYIVPEKEYVNKI